MYVDILFVKSDDFLRCEDDKTQAKLWRKIEGFMPIVMIVMFYRSWRC